MTPIRMQCVPHGRYYCDVCRGQSNLKLVYDKPKVTTQRDMIIAKILEHARKLNW